MSCDRLRDATYLNWFNKGLTTAHMETLGMLLATNGLPTLRELHIGENYLGDEGELVRDARGLEQGVEAGELQRPLGVLGVLELE